MSDFLYKRLELETKSGFSITDLTEDIRQWITSSGIKNGQMLVSSRHTTTAVGINEYESRLLDDLKNYFEKLVPADHPYLHNDIHLRDCPPDEPENAHSHIIALILGQSELIPLVDGELQLGKWQSVLLFELDGPRTRSVNLQLSGN